MLHKAHSFNPLRLYVSSAQDTTTRLLALGISVILNQYGAAGGKMGRGAVMPLGLAATGAL